MAQERCAGNAELLSFNSTSEGPRRDERGTGQGHVERCLNQIFQHPALWQAVHVRGWYEMGLSLSGGKFIAMRAAVVLRGQAHLEVKQAHHDDVGSLLGDPLIQFNLFVLFATSIAHASPDYDRSSPNSSAQLKNGEVNLVLFFLARGERRHKSPLGRRDSVFRLFWGVPSRIFRAFGGLTTISLALAVSSK